ncbi:MAG: ATP-binding protein [Bacteroidia bacterium]|nr:ATP-binding protein [Bacteroidia bacterium]
MKQKQYIHQEITFHLMVEYSPNALILVNEESKIVYVNLYAEKLFKYPKTELIGRGVEILIPERLREKHPGLVKMFFSSPTSRAMGVGRDLYAVKKDGTEFPVEIGLNPLVTIEGTLVLAAIIDISERKIKDAALKKQLELESKNQELEQFAYIASHDLREPLRTINNYIQVIEEDCTEILNDTSRNYFYSINQAIRRMEVLIGALLEYSRLGKDFLFSPVDLNVLLENVKADLASSIHTNQVRIHIGTMPVLNVNEIKIRQLFQNLLSNAIKFRKKNSIPQILILAEKQDTRWKFSIKDNGIGIEEKHFTRIFQIFQRLNTSEEYEGNGIGLANCKKIVELHNGEIWVESTPGEGSVFCFTIATQ